MNTQEIISEWIRCPVCGNKTRDRIREDTVLINYLLYCPKCKQETIINVQQLNMSVIKEPAAQPITNENVNRHLSSRQMKKRKIFCAESQKRGSVFIQQAKNGDNQPVLDNLAFSVSGCCCKS